MDFGKTQEKWNFLQRLLNKGLLTKNYKFFWYNYLCQKNLFFIYDRKKFLIRLYICWLFVIFVA